MGKGCLMKSRFPQPDAFHMFWITTPSFPARLRRGKCKAKADL